jgi:hypothetical protein
MTDRLGFYLWPALAVLVGCAVAARTDAAIVGQPPEPLEPGKHFVITGSRASTMANCLRLIGVPSHSCVYQRNGDTTPTVYVSIADIGAVYRHELYHVQQAARGQPMDHQGWK